MSPEYSVTYLSGSSLIIIHYLAILRFWPVFGCAFGWKMVQADCSVPKIALGNNVVKLENGSGFMPWLVFLVLQLRVLM